MKHTSLLLIGPLLVALFWPLHVIADTEPSSRAKLTFLVIYRPGPAWPRGKSESELPLKDHGNYMLSLYAQGLMKQAGPLTDNTGGAIVANDPAVKAGVFVHELHPWAPVAWEKYLKK